jgi:hypothetical protein
MILVLCLGIGFEGSGTLSCKTGLGRKNTFAYLLIDNNAGKRQDGQLLEQGNV